MKYSDFKNELLKDKKIKAEYDALTPQFEIIAQIIEARQKLNLTQKEFAEKIGTKQSNISRLESGNYNPSLEFLQKIAIGLGKEIHIEII